MKKKMEEAKKLQEENEDKLKKEQEQKEAQKRLVDIEQHAFDY